MNIAIITSKDCPAGKNIKQNLLNLFPFKESEKFDSNQVYRLNNIKLYTINQKHIYAEDLDKKIEAEIFIFATTHRSKSGVNSLSAHPIGNWKNADLGGKENTLVKCPANYLKTAFQILSKSTPEEYGYTIEATHHGPYLEKPTMFIEIGSGEKQWKDKPSGKVIAETIVKTIESVKKHETAVLFGGQHYNHEANKILETTNTAISHICPKFNLDAKEQTILQSFKKSEPEATFAIIDWKGTPKEHKNRLIKILEDADIPWKKSKELKQ